MVVAWYWLLSFDIVFVCDFVVFVSVCMSHYHHYFTLFLILSHSLVLLLTLPILWNAFILRLGGRDLGTEGQVL